MVAFKQCFLAFVALVSSAGPILATHAGGHHLSHSRIAHSRRNLCLSRLSDSSQDPADSETATPISQAMPIYSPPSASLDNDDNDTDSTVPPSPDTGTLTSSSFSSSRELSSTTTTLVSYTPNGMKAGVAGGDAYNILRDHIGWWYDWSANPSKPGRPIAVPMLWGSGHADATDAKRLKQFQRLSSSSSRPQYVLGYEEPDCKSGGGSSGMSVDQGVKEWEALIAPLKRRGTKIGSPSMCSE